MSELEDLEKDIKSVLITSSTGMTLKQFESEYISLVGHEIDPFKYGFDSLQSLLRSFSKSIAFDGSIFCLVPDSSTNHLVALIARQKNAKRGKVSGRGGQQAQRGSAHKNNNNNRQQPFSTSSNSNNNNDQQNAVGSLYSDTRNSQLHSLPIHEERNQNSWNCQQIEHGLEVQKRSNRTKDQLARSCFPSNRNWVRPNQKPNDFGGPAAAVDRINNTQSCNSQAKNEKTSNIHKPNNSGQASDDHQAQPCTFDPVNHAAMQFNKAQSSHLANLEKSNALGPNNEINHFQNDGGDAQTYYQMLFSRGFSDFRQSHQVERSLLEFVRGCKLRENCSSTTPGAVSMESANSKDEQNVVCRPEMIEVTVDELFAALFGSGEFDRATVHTVFKRFHNKRLNTKQFGCPDVFDLVAKHGARRNMFVGKHSDGSKFIYSSNSMNPSGLTVPSQFPVVPTSYNYPEFHRPRPYFTGILSSFQNIDHFHMQDASKVEFRTKIKQEMLVSYQSFLRSYDNSQVIPWTIGSPCVVINNYTVHRCRIQQLPRSNGEPYVLLLVDKGHLIKTNKPIFPLLRQFADFPPQAIPCCYKHDGKLNAFFYSDQFTRLIEYLLRNVDCQCRCFGFNCTKLEIEIIISHDVTTISRALAIQS